MTTCDYCGGEHNRSSCPNCGAPIHRPADTAQDSRQFKLQMMSAMGLPAHLFRTDPLVRQAVTLAEANRAFGRLANALNGRAQ